MTPRPDCGSLQDDSASGPAGEGCSAPEDTRSWLEQRPRQAGILLALLPAVSFLGQYLASRRAGTQELFFRHLTVMVVDWVFVPFNYYVVWIIDWRRGGRLYWIACVSAVLSVWTHAYWQYNGLDSGYMINKAGVVLPAGWMHVVFSILEMVLVVGFLFCRRRDKPSSGGATISATAYFVMMAICGYAMHHGFILSDVVVSSSGLFFVLIYPRLVGRA